MRWLRISTPGSDLLRRRSAADVSRGTPACWDRCVGTGRLWPAQRDHRPGPRAHGVGAGGPCGSRTFHVEHPDSAGTARAEVARARHGAMGHPTPSPRADAINHVPRGTSSRGPCAHLRARRQGRPGRPRNVPRGTNRTARHSAAPPCRQRRTQRHPLPPCADQTGQAAGGSRACGRVDNRPATPRAGRPSPKPTPAGHDMFHVERGGAGISVGSGRRRSTWNTSDADAPIGSGCPRSTWNMSITPVAPVPSHRGSTWNISTPPVPAGIQSRTFHVEHRANYPPARSPGAAPLPSRCPPAMNGLPAGGPPTRADGA
jgi:hypothetical protein